MLPNLVGMVAFFGLGGWGVGIGIHFLVEDITGSVTGHLKVFNKLSPPHAPPCFLVEAPWPLITIIYRPPAPHRKIVQGGGAEGGLGAYPQKI